MAGELILPGMVDLHVHFRQPSTNNAETIESGSMAALHGGYSMYVDMPNNPGLGNQTWTMERAQHKANIIRYSSRIPGGIWAGSQPESDNIGQLAAMMGLCLGTKFYASKTTNNPNEYEAVDFREAAKVLHKTSPDKPIALHAGEDNLADFIGMIASDLKHPLHVCHVSKVRDVELITEAKRRDLPVTCGVTPHHILKTSHDVLTQGMFASMMPPLVHQDEAEGLFGKLVDGDIDIIETDHAPHLLESKMHAECEGGECFGVPGIELAVPLMLYQASKKRISHERIIEVMSTRPTEIIGLTLSKNTKVAWDMETYRVGDDEEKMSGSGWSPYLGMMAVGVVQDAWIDGNQVLGYGTTTVREHAKVMTRRGMII